MVLIERLSSVFYGYPMFHPKKRVWIVLVFFFVFHVVASIAPGMVVQVSEGAVLLTRLPAGEIGILSRQEQ
jgi:hypothetical protein